MGIYPGVFLQVIGINGVQIADTPAAPAHLCSLHDLIYGMAAQQVHQMVPVGLIRFAAVGDGHRQQYKVIFFRMQDFIFGQIGRIDSIGGPNQFTVIPLEAILIISEYQSGGRGRDLEEPLEGLIVPIGKMVIEPESATRAIRQVGKNVVGSHGHQARLDSAGFHPPDGRIDPEGIAQQSRTYQAIKIRSGDYSHPGSTPIIALRPASRDSAVIAAKMGHRHNWPFT